MRVSVLGTKLFWKNAGNTNKTIISLSFQYNYLAMDPPQKPRKEIFIHLVFRFYELLLNDGVEFSLLLPLTAKKWLKDICLGGFLPMYSCPRTLVHGTFIHIYLPIYICLRTFDHAIFTQRRLFWLLLWENIRGSMGKNPMGKCP